MTKREKVHELMKLKGYFDCLEKRLKCLSPILPYLESKEGIETPRPQIYRMSWTATFSKKCRRSEKPTCTN